MVPVIRWSPAIQWSPAIRWSVGSIDFVNPKVYGDTSITDGLVLLSSIKSPRKDNDAHCCQNFYPQYWLFCHFCFSLDSFSAFASHGKEAVSQVLHFQKWKYNISHLELILKFHVCSRPFDDESSFWSTAQNVLDLVSPRWRVSYFAYISRKSFPPIEINGKNWLPASSGWYGFCVADSRGRDQFPSIKSWDVENIHPPQI